jgi:hypothetical protein
MSNPDEDYEHGRYRKLLAEATDEQKRLALIDLLIREKARDRLARQMLRARLSGLGLKAEAPRGETVFTSLQYAFRHTPH